MNYSSRKNKSILQTLKITWKTPSSYIWLCDDTRLQGFPGGPLVETLPSNVGDMGSIPGWGTKIPHAVGYGEKTL